MSVEIIEMLIPKSNKKTRPGTKRKPKTITIHETANTNVRANALAHARLQSLGNARQASWHLQVDDEKEVYKSVPFDEVAWAAGDGGKGPGNMYSIHIEVCVNSDGNFKKALENTAETVRYLLKKYPSITHVDIVQHYKWSKKNCPRYLRSGEKGINWKGFLEMVKNEGSTADKPTTPPKYETSNTNFKINQKVRIKKSAKTYATGETIPASIKGKTDSIMQRGSNRMLLKGIYSWVRSSDLEVVGASKPAPKPPANNTIIKVGSKVTLSNSAKKYATGETIPASIKGKKYTVQQLNGNRVLLKEIYSWVNKKDVGGGTTSTSTPKPPTLRKGSKAKIKSGAGKYSRSNVTIPAKYKGKSYTIQQVGKNDVLLKELISWVKKSDLY